MLLYKIDSVGMSGKYIWEKISSRTRRDKLKITVETTSLHLNFRIFATIISDVNVNNIAAIANVVYTPVGRQFPTHARARIRERERERELIHISVTKVESKSVKVNENGQRQ